MKIEISGSRCISCYKYTQYYRSKFGEGFEAIDCGYCGIKSRNVRPGDRCREYKEASNVSWIGHIEKVESAAITRQ